MDRPPSKTLMTKAELIFVMVSTMAISTITGNLSAQTFEPTELLRVENMSEFANEGLAVHLDDDHGRYYVGGYFKAPSGQSVELFGESVVSQGAGDAFLAAFDTSGDTLWVISLGGNGNEYITDITCSSNGDIYLSGQIASQIDIDIDGQGLTQVGSSNADAFIARMTPSGQWQWFKTYGGEGNDLGLRVAVIADSVYLAMAFTHSSTPIGPTETEILGTPVPEDLKDVSSFAIIGHNGLGDAQWKTYFGGEGDDLDSTGPEVIRHRKSSALDLVSYRNRLYVSFAYRGSLKAYDGYNLQTIDDAGGSDDPDIALIAYGPRGRYLWHQRMNSDNGDILLSSVAADCQGIYLAANYNTQEWSYLDPPGGSAGADNVSMNGLSGHNQSIMKYDHNGQMQWHHVLGSTETGHGNIGISDMDTDSRGNLFFIGFTTSDVQAAVGDCTTDGIQSRAFDEYEDVLIGAHRTDCPTTTDFQLIQGTLGSENSRFSGRGISVSDTQLTASVSVRFPTITSPAHRSQTNCFSGISQNNFGGSAGDCCELTDILSCPISSEASPMELSIHPVFCAAQFPSDPLSIVNTCDGLTLSITVLDESDAVVTTSSTFNDISLDIGTYRVEVNASLDAQNLECIIFVEVVDDAPPTVAGCDTSNNIAIEAGNNCSGLYQEFHSDLTIADCSTPIDVWYSHHNSSTPLSQDIWTIIGPIGTKTFDAHIVDSRGNATICSRTFEIVDTTPPEIVLPTENTLDNTPDSCGHVFTGPPYFGLTSVSDACDVVDTRVDVFQDGSLTPIASSDTSYLYDMTLAVGEYGLVFYAEDLYGNSTDMTMTLHIIDTEAPQFVCQGDQTIILSSFSCQAEVMGMGPVVTDNCTTPDVEYIIMKGTTQVAQGNGSINGQILDGPGVYDVTYVASDGIMGNGVANCQFSITVLDETPPSIGCPQSQTFDSEDNSCGRSISDGLDVLTTAENCGATYSHRILDTTGTELQGSTSGMLTEYFFPVGTSTVEYTATDGSSNSGTCSFTITIDDIQAPTISCHDQGTIQIGAPVNACEVLIADHLDTLAHTGIMDDCDVQELELDIFIDGSGSSLSEAEFAASSLPVGIHDISYQVTDGAGHLGQCTTTVEVIDTTALSPTCPADIVLEVDEYCLGIYPAGQSPTIPFDNCNNGMSTGYQLSTKLRQSMNGVYQTVFISSIEFAAGNTMSIGEYELEYTLTDDSGNSASCQSSISVGDTTPPVIVCSDETVEMTEDGVAEIQIADLVVSMVDHCPPLSIDLVSGETTYTDIGVYTVVISSTDASGNVGMDTSFVTVIDLLPPSASCIGEWTVYLDEQGTVTIDDPSALDNGSTDNDGISSYSLSLNTFDCADLEDPQAIQYYVTDHSLNVDSCTIQITVLDTIGPVIQCPEDSTYLLEEDCERELTLTATSSDNCTPPLLTHSWENGSGDATANLSLPVGTYQVSWSAENASSCTTVITIEDPIAPIILDCPKVEAGCDPEVFIDQPEVSDNCEYQVFSSPDISQGYVFTEGITDVVWTIDDGTHVTSCITQVEVSAAVDRAYAGEDFHLELTSTTSLDAGPPIGSVGEWTVVVGSAVIADPHSPTTEVSGLEIGLTTLRWTITNEACDAQSFDEVDIIVDGFNMPTGFSPNGDGVNDVLYIQGIRSFPDNRLSVYNRWGKLVYEQVSYENDWGGLKKGRLLSPDTYFYILETGSGEDKGVASVYKGFLEIKH